MNYLAHAYLSFGLPEIIVGNLISDFVKGKKRLDYPPMIQQGIALHRLIDDFTDHHPLTREAAAVFRPFYGRYAGALTDVVYDYFLANDEAIFPGWGKKDGEGAGLEKAGLGKGGVGKDGVEVAGLGKADGGREDRGQGPKEEGPGMEDGGSVVLAKFAKGVYDAVGEWEGILPEQFGRMFPYMRSQNWLYSYRSREGIYNSIRGLQRRARYMAEPQQAFAIFDTSYEHLKACYTGFFPVLQERAHSAFIQLSGNTH